MIWALLALWLFGGGGGHSVRPFTMTLTQAEALIVQHVPDQTRRAQALAVLELMEEVEAERARALADYQVQLHKLVDDRASAADRIGSLIAAERTKAVAFQERMLDLRFQLTAHLTPAEWGQVFSVPAATR